MKNRKDNKTVLSIYTAILLAAQLLLVSGCIDKSDIKTGLEINGVVNDYQSNTPAKGIEVSYIPMRLTPSWNTCRLPGK